MSKATCAVEDCERPHRARGVCSAHWQEWRKSGAPSTGFEHLVAARRTRSGGGTCSIEGCPREIWNLTHGWCQRHYDTWYRHGDPRGGHLPRRPCGSRDCSEPTTTFGLCAKHHLSDPVSPGHRRCSNCLAHKRLDEFSPNPGYKDGIDGQCRPCVRAETNRRRRANPDAARRASQKYRERYPDRTAAAMAAWRKKNPDRVREGSARRRVRRAANDVRLVTERDWRRLCARLKHRCAYCGSAGPLTQDHIVPVSRGGRHAIGNLLPACQPCNTSKRARLLVEWRFWQKNKSAICALPSHLLFPQDP
jgi:5-methylcytosine-specific restriction endonuclease McrA